MRLKILVAIGLLVLGLGAVGFVLFAPNTAGSQAGSQFLTSRATVTDVTKQAVATGNLSAGTTFLLSFGQAAQISSGTSDNGQGTGSGTWPVKEVRVKVGDSVHKGDLLAVADGTDALLAQRTAEASLASARDRLNADLDNAASEAQIAADRASIGALQQQVSAAKVAVAQATLKAPADGVVTVVAIAAGFDAPSGTAIQVASGGLVVAASFTESDVPSLKVGQPATVTITSLGATADGTVTLVEPVATSSSGSSVVTFQVQVALTNPPAAARPGMSVSVAVTTAQASSVLAVPAIALVGSAGNYEVRVLSSDGQTQLVPVEVGLVTSSLAEIKSGLTEGQAVVVGTSTQRTGTGGGTSLPGLGFPAGGGTRNFGGGGNQTVPGQP